MRTAKDIFSYPAHRAGGQGAAPFLPLSRQEMGVLGWDECDIILVTGDAYVDHPSFGMALVGRLLEAQGFRVGIIAQPDWASPRSFFRDSPPNFGRYRKCFRGTGRRFLTTTSKGCSRTSAIQSARSWMLGTSQSFLRHNGGEHGFHGEPLYRRASYPQR